MTEPNSISVRRDTPRHYSHIRMRAKREALESVVKPTSASSSETMMEPQDCGPLCANEQEVEEESLQSTDFRGIGNKGSHVSL